MGYRSILVFLDHGAGCEARCAYALELARRHEAHLIGLAPTGVTLFPVTIDGAAALVEYADIAARAVCAEAERAVQLFRDACLRASCASFEALAEESAEARSIVRHAHRADLVVLTQADPAASQAMRFGALVEDVVLNSPRPTLVLPYAGCFDAAARAVLVAWDGSREAGRALGDALPLLHRCERVHLVRWSEAKGYTDPALRERLEVMRQWLERHRITAEVHLEGTLQIGIGDAILSRAAELQADLIVMGAYGHPRWTERILGGATHGLLSAMTVPVLMAH